MFYFYSGKQNKEESSYLYKTSKKYKPDTT